MASRKQRERQKVTPGKVASNARRNNKSRTKSSVAGTSTGVNVTYLSSYEDFARLASLSSSKAFAVLARMRRTGESLHQASRSKNTYQAYVLKHLKKAARREGQPNPLRKVKDEWVASPSDKLSRRRDLLTDQGYVSIVVKGSKKSSELSRYNSTVDRLVNPQRYAKRLGPSKEEVFAQALDDLKYFRGKSIAGKPYLTDPDLVFRLGDSGIIKTEELGSDQVARGGRK